MAGRSLTSATGQLLALLGLTMAIATGPRAAAGVPAAIADGPTVIDRLLACRTLAEPAARLACFDQASAAASAALAHKDVVVINRQTMRRTRVSLFGLALPRLAIFGDDDSEEIKQIESTVSAARARPDGFIFDLKDGSQWTQTDGAPFALPPEPGDKVVVKKGALGSFMLKLAGQPGVKVIRSR